MIQQWRRSCLVMLLATMVMAAGSPTVSAAPIIALGEYPRTDGTFVVWWYGGIYAARVSDRQPFMVSRSNRITRRSPDIADGIVVWSEDQAECMGLPCRSDILAKNLITNQEFVVAATLDDEIFPRISGKLVIWNANGATLGRDLTTMAEPFLVAQSTPEVAAGFPEIEGSQVYWVEQVQLAPETVRWRIMRRTITAGQPGEPAIITEGVATELREGPGYVTEFAVGGNIGILFTRTEQYAINLQTGQEVFRPWSGGTNSATTDGRYIFGRSFVSPQEAGLRGYDLQTNSEFVVEPGFYGSPHTAGGVLVWVRGASPQDILVARIADVVPTAPRPAPSAPIPDSQHFPQTGHALFGGFRAFWERSGGLPVFGYPLTEEFDEHNPDLGQPFTVQYFERQRFEYHPENAGTPYEVLLGRLGAAEAQALGLSGTPPFQPQPATPDTSTCTFVRETGHRLCEPFRTYWQTHGLEFGDSGVSEREALALWGYPLSEAYTDAATGRLVQYFERARFEYHPDNPPEFQVLLGRLGVRPLVERGWLTAE